LNLSWVPSERFTTRRLQIEEDPDRWEDLMRTIEDDLTLYPSPHQFVPGRKPWRIFKIRPGTEGFPGLAILFSIQEGNTRACVLEDAILTDDPERLGFTDYIAEHEAWTTANLKTNGSGPG